MTMRIAGVMVMFGLMSAAAGFSVGKAAAAGHEDQQTVVIEVPSPDEPATVSCEPIAEPMPSGD
jgi:hypothetical protein